MGGQWSRDVCLGHGDVAGLGTKTRKRENAGFLRKRGSFLENGRFSRKRAFGSNTGGFGKIDDFLENGRFSRKRAVLTLQFVTDDDLEEL